MRKILGLLFLASAASAFPSGAGSVASAISRHSESAKDEEKASLSTVLSNLKELNLGPKYALNGSDLSLNGTSLPASLFWLLPASPSGLNWDCVPQTLSKCLSIIEKYAKVSEQEAFFNKLRLEEEDVGIVSRSMSRWNNPSHSLQLAHRFYPQILSRMPSDFVDNLNDTLIKNKEFRTIINEMSTSDWSTASKGELCAWKDVLSTRFNVPKDIYTAFKQDSPSPLSSMTPFLRCYSPSMIASWKFDSEIANNKYPLWRMMRKHRELKLNALQVQKLTDCYVWTSPASEKNNLIYLLDVKQVTSDDLHSDLDFIKNHRIQWPLIIKVWKLKNLVDLKIGNISSSADLLQYKGLIVTQSARKLEETKGNLSTKKLNELASPNLRRSQSRALLNKTLSYESLHPDILFALSANKILKSSSATVSKISEKKSLLPSQHFAVFLFNGANGIKQPYNQPDILKFIHPRSKDINNIQLSQHLPLSLRLKVLDQNWKSKNISKDKLLTREILSSEFSSPVISGLTCVKLKSSVNELDYPLAAASYNAHINSLTDGEIIRTFPLSLAVCFKESLTSYLSKKKEIFNSENSMWDSMTLEDVDNFGGYILSTLNVTELDEMKISVRRYALEAIGRIHTRNLMAIVDLPHLESVAKYAWNEFKTNKTMFGELFKLGSLNYFLGSEISENVPSLEIKKMLRRFSSPEFKLVCLPQDARKRLAKAIIKAYGSPRYWTAWEITEVGDLLITLDDSELKSIFHEEFRLALPMLLNSSQFQNVYQQFPSFYSPNVPFYQACSAWLSDDNNNFIEDYNSLMRRYLGIAQYSVNVAQNSQNVEKHLIPTQFRERKDLKKKLIDIHRNLKTKLSSDDQMQSMAKFQFMRRFAEIINREKNETIAHILDLPLNDHSVNYTREYHEFKKRNSSDSGVKIETIENFLLSSQKTLIREIKYFMNYSGTDLSSPKDFMSESLFCSMVDCIDPLWCSIFDCKSHEEIDLGLTCDGIISSEESAISIESRDIQNWSKDQVLDCLDVLGSIPYYDVEMKLNVWNVIKEHVDLHDPRQLLNLGSLLEAVMTTNPTDVPLTDIDAVSIMGSFEYPSEILSKASKRMRDYVTTSDNDVSLRLFSIMSFICHGNDETAEFLVYMFRKVTPDIFVSIVGQLKTCDNKNIRDLIANMIYDEYKTFDSWDIAAMGLFSTSLPTEVVNGMNDENFESIQPSAVRYVDSEKLDQLSLNKVTFMSPEALAMFDIESMPERMNLTVSQLNNLHEFKHLIKNDRLNYHPTSRTESAASTIIINHIYFIAFTFIFFMYYL